VGVGSSGGRQLGNSSLARSQRLGPGEHHPPRASTRCGELLLRPQPKRPRAAAMRHVECRPQMLPRLGALVGAPQRGS
jgi:hypothetical protein